MSQDIGFDRNEDHDPFFLSGPKRRIREARPGGGGQRVTKSGAGTVPAGSTRPVPPNPTVPRSFLPIPLLLLASLAWGQDDALAREWRQAMKWDSTGKHAQALRVYDRFVNEAPWAYRARMARSGLYLEKLNKPDAGFTDLAEAMLLEPDSMAPYLNRSSYYLNRRMVDRALADLDDALARSRRGSDSVSVYVNQGSALGMIRRFTDAVASYDKALAIDPDDWAALSNKAAVLDDLGRYAEAREILLGLHKRKPEELVVLNNLGFQASRQDDFEGAMHWFTEALRHAPDDPYVLSNLSYVQLRTGRSEEALRSVQRSIKLNPANSYAYRNLGLVWQAQGDKHKACAAFEEALKRGFTGQYGPEVRQLRAEYCK